MRRRRPTFQRIDLSPPGRGDDGWSPIGDQELDVDDVRPERRIIPADATGDEVAEIVRELHAHARLGVPATKPADPQPRGHPDAAAE